MDQKQRLTSYKVAIENTLFSSTKGKDSHILEKVSLGLLRHLNFLLSRPAGMFIIISFSTIDIFLILAIE